MSSGRCARSLPCSRHRWVKLSWWAAKAGRARASASASVRRDEHVAEHAEARGAPGQPVADGRRGSAEAGSARRRPGSAPAPCPAAGRRSRSRTARCSPRRPAAGSRRRCWSGTTAAGAAAGRTGTCSGTLLPSPPGRRNTAGLHRLDEGREQLLEPVGGVAAGEPVHRCLDRRGALADADLEAAVAELVEHADLLHQPQRVVERHDEGGRRQPDGAGPARGGGEEDRR